MKQKIIAALNAVKSSPVAVGGVLALSSMAAMADDTFDVSPATLYAVGVLAAIGTVGSAWLGISYLKKGWKLLRGV